MLEIIGATIAVILSYILVRKSSTTAKSNESMHELYTSQLSRICNDMESLTSYAAVDCTDNLEQNLKAINDRIESVRRSVMKDPYVGRRESSHVYRTKGSKRNKPAY